MTGPEKKVEQYFCMAVLAAGGIHRKIEYAGRRGCPDRLVGFKNGYTALVELKRPGAEPRPEQEREHEILHAHGFRVLTISTVEQVELFIQRATGR